jgi:tetratricopeptide (TPR) repeat protein
VTNKNYIKFSGGFVFFCLLFTLCKNSENAVSPSEETVSTELYLNHGNEAEYVGMNSCKQCHQSIYNSFINTGMGKSFDIATKAKSAADFTSAYVEDKNDDFKYFAYWHKDSLFFREYRIEKGDTTFRRNEQVNYIIGSGQHTNSHIQNINGYLHQMPMTWYSQKKHWDLPPGFEDGFNTHFTRKIGLECMTCHNAYPAFELGSENKFKAVPLGIDCERCHGPGNIHVNQRKTGSSIDTSRFIDYSIVNPAKLQVDLQFDICQRCHLQGNAVLKEGKSFYDFRPGMKLSDFISVFLPKYSNSDEAFIMASHADRLKQSACFIKSLEKNKQSNLLKPYKNVITCVTCHNPHISVKETNKNVFNEACLNCHQSSEQNQKNAEHHLESIHKTVRGAGGNFIKSDCVKCHMPQSGATDIPHVSVHDHFIRKPITKKETDKIKQFLGLFSINEKNPDSLTRAKAYISQYDKFEQKAYYLDSAERLINDKGSTLIKNLSTLIQLNFTKQNHRKIIDYVNEIGEEKCLNTVFVKQSYDNRDAWSSYHISEAYYYLNQKTKSLRWLTKSVQLAPFNLEFRTKLGSRLAESVDLEAAANQYQFIMRENPKYISAYSNLGFIRLQQGLPAEALRLYFIGEKLNPDNEALLLNLAGYFILKKDKKQAVVYLNKILKRNPGHQRAKSALKQVQEAL